MRITYTWSSDGKTLTITPYDKRGKFPDGYTLTEQGATLVMKAPGHQPIALGDTPPKPYTVTSRTKWQIVIENSVTRKIRARKKKQ